MDDGMGAAPIESGPVTAEPTLPNLMVRFVQVLTSPAKLFDALGGKPRWLGALLLAVGVGIAIVALIPLELIEEMMMAQVPADATPEQMEAMESQAGLAGVLRWLGPAVFQPIMLLIIAVFLLLVFNLLMGGEASFKQLFAFTTHANLIGIVGGLVTLPLILARGSLDTAMSLGLLAPGMDSGSFAFKFLNGLNLFGIWTAVVLGIAMSRLYPKVSTGTAVGILLGTYVVIKFIGAAIGGLAG
ncbi:MAG: YIP1 family protein [Gemmatimonadota bacterium]